VPPANRIIPRISTTTNSPAADTAAAVKAPDTEAATVSAASDNVMIRISTPASGLLIADITDIFSLVSLPHLIV